MWGRGMEGKRYEGKGNGIDRRGVIDGRRVGVGVNGWKMERGFGEMSGVGMDRVEDGFEKWNDRGGGRGDYR